MFSCFEVGLCRNGSLSEDANTTEDEFDSGEDGEVGCWMVVRCVCVCEGCVVDG